MHCVFWCRNPIAEASDPESLFPRPLDHDARISAGAAALPADAAQGSRQNWEWLMRAASVPEQEEPHCGVVTNSRVAEDGRDDFSAPQALRRSVRDDRPRLSAPVGRQQATLRPTFLQPERPEEFHRRCDVARCCSDAQAPCRRRGPGRHPLSIQGRLTATSRLVMRRPVCLA